ncbi:MAG: hypothetical protein ABIQ62_09740, partial [Thermomonas sp.]
LVLASPLTVCLVVLGRYVPFLKFLDTLLGNRPALAPSHRLYQRMLAQDEAEATALMNELSEVDGLEVLYDGVVVPMLAHARDDLRSGRLDKAVHDRLVDDASDIIDGHRQVVRSEATVGVERMSVLGIPSRDELDEVALAMLGKLVDIGRVEWTSAGSDSLSSEVVAKVKAHPYKVIVLMALPPGGLAHVRYLCRRLRAEEQAVKILVVRPGLYADDTPRQRRELLDAGASQVVTSMKDAVVQLNELALLD